MLQIVSTGTAIKYLENNTNLLSQLGNYLNKTKLLFLFAL